MFFSQPKFRTIFKTHTDFVSTEPKEKLPPPNLPIPETKKEAKQQERYKWLPGERLAISLSKQAKKERKKDKSLSSSDIERLTASMGRVTQLMKT